MNIVCQSAQLIRVEQNNVTEEYLSLSRILIRGSDCNTVTGNCQLWVVLSLKMLD